MVLVAGMGAVVVLMEEESFSERITVLNQQKMVYYFIISFLIRLFNPIRFLFIISTYDPTYVYMNVCFNLKS